MVLQKASKEVSRPGWGVHVDLIRERVGAVKRQVGKRSVPNL